VRERWKRVPRRRQRPEKTGEAAGFVKEYRFYSEHKEKPSEDSEPPKFGVLEPTLSEKLNVRGEGMRRIKEGDSSHLDEKNKLPRTPIPFLLNSAHL
jgi:hypothetical protein